MKLPISIFFSKCSKLCPTYINFKYFEVIPKKESKCEIFDNYQFVILLSKNNEFIINNLQSHIMFLSCLNDFCRFYVQ